MANIRREKAPRTAAVRLRAGRVGLRRGALTASSARVAFGRIVHGGRIVCLSKGAVSLAECVGYVLETTGPADLTLATWTIGAREITTFRDLVAGGSVRRLQLLVDASFVQRQPAYTASLRASFGPDCVRLVTSHLKVALLVNARWAVVVLSSANLNRNSRLEFFQVEDNRRLATAISGTLGEWFAEPAADQWDASMTAHKRRFDAWGETGSRTGTPGAGAAIATAADGDVRAPVDAPVRPLAPATAGDAAYFSDDPWGVDLRRAGISFTR